MKIELSYLENLTCKYQVDSDFNHLKVLKFILVKAELNHPLNQFEKDFLKNHKLVKTLQIIKHQEEEYS